MNDAAQAVARAREALDIYPGIALTGESGDAFALAADLIVLIHVEERDDLDDIVERLQAQAAEVVYA